MPVESSNKQRTALRKKVTNKEELIKYLNAHLDSELPFVEVCWEDAVRKDQAVPAGQPEAVMRSVRAAASAAGPRGRPVPCCE